MKNELLDVCEEFLSFSIDIEDEISWDIGDRGEPFPQTRMSDELSEHLNAIRTAIRKTKDQAEAEKASAVTGCYVETILDTINMARKTQSVWVIYQFPSKNDYEIKNFDEFDIYESVGGKYAYDFVKAEVGPNGNVDTKLEFLKNENWRKRMGMDD